MTRIDEEKYCQCGKEVPITHLGICEGCGKPYLFPGGRKTVTHPRPLEEVQSLLEEVVKRSDESRRGLENKEWDKVWEQFLDAEQASTTSGYFIMGAGVFCNPRLYGMVMLLFTSLEGVLLWKKLRYSGVQYDVRICRTV